MTMEIVVTKDFTNAFGILSPSMKDNVRRKVRSLVVDPAYPSLKTHRFNQVKSNDIRDCYISDSMRLLYEIAEGCLRLWDLGPHGIVDKVHLRRFASHTHFHYIEEFMLENSVTETHQNQHMNKLLATILFSKPL